MQLVSATPTTIQNKRKLQPEKQEGRQKRRYSWRWIDNYEKRNTGCCRLFHNNTTLSWATDKFLLSKAFQRGPPRKCTKETNKTTSSLLSFSPLLILLIKEVLPQFSRKPNRKSTEPLELSEILMGWSHYFHTAKRELRTKVLNSTRGRRFLMRMDDYLR